MYVLSFTCSTFHLFSHNYVFFLFRSFLPINIKKMTHSIPVFPRIQYSSQDDTMYKYINYYFTHIIRETIQSKERETFLLL